MLEPEARGGDEGLVAVLLDEHPLQDQAEFLPVIGKELRAANGLSFA